MILDAFFCRQVSGPIALLAELPSHAVQFFDSQCRPRSTSTSARELLRTLQAA